MDDMTPEEKKAVDELRKRTIDDVTPKMLEDDSVFYRFAKARDFNLLEAEVMLRKHLNWRKEMEIDTILTDYEPPEVLTKYAPTTLVCFDKKGSIVRLIDLGRVDAKGLWNTVTKNELLKFIAYIMEKDKDMLIKKGQSLGKPMYAPIYDFDELSYANAVNLKSLHQLSCIMKMFVDNFPETIKCISTINAPFYFTFIFSAIKQVVPKTVIRKFRVYGTDGWKEDLLEMIDADLLPAYLGGTRADPDGNPLCNTFIHRGRPIPKSYYKTKSNKKPHSPHGIEKLIVRPCSKKETTFEVNKENSFLEWEFDIKGSDVDFALLYKESKNSESVELVPKQRMDTCCEPEKGSLRCEKTGTYTIVFDNSYSWLHSKEIHFKAEVKGPKKDEKYDMQ